VRGVDYNTAYLNLNTVEIDVIEVEKSRVGVSCMLEIAPNNLAGFGVSAQQPMS
jgi:hypothetical protein